MIRHRERRVAALDGLLHVAVVGRLAVVGAGEPHQTNRSDVWTLEELERVIAPFDRRRVLLLLGGRDKGGDFSTLRPLLADRVAMVLLIGEAAGAIERQIAGAAPVARCGDMASAVAQARAAAREGDVVLLAPGCASFDQYRNYEERGEHFRRLSGGVEEGR